MDDLRAEAILHVRRRADPAVSPRRVLDLFDLTDPLPLLATLAAEMRRDIS